MSYRVTFLAASDGTPLSKTFTYNDGKVTTAPYPLIKHLSSFTEEFDTIEELHALILDHGDQGHALHTGRLVHPLDNESRAGKSDKVAPMDVFICDYDGLSNITEAEAAGGAGIASVDRIVQLSGSAGLPGNEAKLNAHSFTIMAVPQHEDTLCRYIEGLNYNTPCFSSRLSLTASKMGLHYPLDRTMGQASRIVYIAPPTFVGMTDPLGDGRTTIVKADNRTLALQVGGVLTKDKLRKASREQVQRLRQVAGMAEVDLKTSLRKGYDGAQYDTLVNPEVMHVDVHDTARGFTYVDLNGGDSHGYFHPDDDATLLHNFKGEPCLPLAKLNPAYFATANKRAKQLRLAAQKRAREEDLAELHDEANTMLDALGTESEEVVHFYFTDDDTGGYKIGTYDPNEPKLEIRDRKNKEQLIDFASQFGLPEPAVIPSVQARFEPTRTEVYAPAGPGMVGKVNLYVPTLYRCRATKGIVTTPPSTIFKLLRHVAGGSETFTDHFLNWLAYIYQTGRKTQAAWVFTGTTGTGKDTVMDYVLRPLIGHAYCVTKRLDQLQDKFNSELTRAILVWVNEASLEKLSNVEMVSSMLKELITGGVVGIRGMRQALISVESFLNVIMASNSTTPFKIEANDRRWNVPPRQETPLTEVSAVGPMHQKRLTQELQAMADYLVTRTVDENAVKVPLYSDAKTELQRNSQSLAETLAYNLDYGDFEYLVDQLPDFIGPPKLWKEKVTADEPLLKYVNQLDKVAVSIRQKKAAGLTTDDLHDIFGYVLGGTWVPERQTKAKFTRAVRHFGWQLNASTGTRVTVGGKQKAGRRIEFKATEEVMANYFRYHSLNKGLALATP